VVIEFLLLATFWRQKSVGLLAENSSPRNYRGEYSRGNLFGRLFD